MSKPAISIIIANYNNGHFFEDCYQSLLNQTDGSWEAIVIDDCSTDNSFNVIKEIIKEDSRFVLVQNEQNLGYQRTLLRGVELSTAAVFARLDPDDAIDKDAVSISLARHAEFPEIGLTYSNVVFCRDDMTPFYTMKCKQADQIDGDLVEVYKYISHFATFKRVAYEKTTGFDALNRRAEDKDIYMKMHEVAPVHYIDRDLYYYRHHSTNASKDKNKSRAFFWFFVAVIKAGERRKVNVEDLFLEHYIDRADHQEQLKESVMFVKYLKNSRWFKLGKWLGFLKSI